jgi:hypothetical protein
MLLRHCWRHLVAQQQQQQQQLAGVVVKEERAHQQQGAACRRSWLVRGVAAAAGALPQCLWMLHQQMGRRQPAAAVMVSLAAARSSLSIWLSHLKR